MSMQLRKLALVLFATAALGGIAGCEREGPMERAGENLDEASRDLGNAIEDKCEDAKERMGADDTDC
jgi:hypothetical protein